jgi:hypothetical protein
MTPETKYVGRKGTVKNGKHVGFTVRIDNDQKNTGGYLILLENEYSTEGFDYWVKTEKDLEQFFYESEWIIEWHA